MSRLLISWISDYNDFVNRPDGLKVKLDGPTLSLHQEGSGVWTAEHERHLLLSTKEPGFTPDLHLRTQLYKLYPQRKVVVHGLDIHDDAFDYLKVRTALEKVLDPLSDYAGQIDLFITTGTTAMRSVMILLHLTHPAPTRLIIGKDARATGGAPAFEELVIHKDQTLSRLYMRLGEPAVSGEDFYLAQCLKPVYQRAERIAQVDGVYTLIWGGSGTGKERLARYIHDNSARSKRPFVAVNCAALTDELLESRLFGHKKGSFTHATEDRKGFFAQAHRGTLFLDEIGDISPQMQQSLLRALQEKEITRVGETEAVKVDVRIVAATNRPLPTMIGQGQFRSDLYYRLATTELHLPSLDDYPTADREALIEHLLQHVAREYQLPPLPLSPAVRQLLLTYPFPGNIRELRNAIVNFYVFADGEVQPEHLPLQWQMEQIKPDLSLASLEARHIRRVLDIMGHNLTHTYQVLGFKSVNTLKAKMEKYGIERPQLPQRAT